METTTGQEVSKEVSGGMKREQESVDDFEHLEAAVGKDPLSAVEDFMSSKDLFSSKDLLSSKDPLSAEEPLFSKDPLSFLSGSDPLTKELDPVKQEVNNTISATKDFLADLTAEYTKVEPLEAKPVEIKPVEAKPVEIKPVEVKPVEIKPVEDKPVEIKPVEVKPVEIKPVEVNLVETKPVESKPVEVKPVESKSAEAEPTEGKAVESEPFLFSKPLPKEPVDEVSEFLKAETGAEEDEARNLTPEPSPSPGKPREPSPSPPPSPPKSLGEDLPPPVPKHQNLHDDSPMDAFEPSQTPEPDYEAVKPYPFPEDRPESSDIGANDLFCEYGLDAWFNPERLHPRVESLVYWREPKKSGAVFGVLMVTLLSLAYCSLISVTAYLCLASLSFTIAFRIYRNIMQAVQKTSDGHPFKEYLEMDIGISEERVREAGQAGVERFNKGLVELRRLFLVEDLVDSLKFAVMLWALTYVGAWFNGLTLVIIGVILMFTLPKVYENNKSQVDAYISLATAKISDITNKVKAAVPMGKKDGGEKAKDQ